LPPAFPPNPAGNRRGRRSEPASLRYPQYTTHMPLLIRYTSVAGAPTGFRDAIEMAAIGWDLTTGGKALAQTATDKALV